MHEDKGSFLRQGSMGGAFGNGLKRQGANNNLLDLISNTVLDSPLTWERGDSGNGATRYYYSVGMDGWVKCTPTVGLGRTDGRAGAGGGDFKLPKRQLFN